MKKVLLAMTLGLGLPVWIQAQEGYPTAAADSVMVPSDTRDQVERRILDSILDGHGRAGSYGDIADDLLERNLRRNAEQSIPNEQRIREIAIVPHESRGPFTVETHAGHTSTIALLDAHGNPWPLTGVPINSNPNAYGVSWSESAPHIVIISVNQPFIETTMSLMLQGQTLPLVFRLKNSGGVQDALLTAKVTGLSPYSEGQLMASAPSPHLSHDSPSLSRWVNGDIPDGAQSLSLTGNTGSRAWRYRGLFILETQGSPVFPSDPFVSESAPDSDIVIYGFRSVPDAIAVQFHGARPIVMRVM